MILNNIYIKSDLKITDIIPPEYQYKTNNTISLKNVTCDLSSSSTKINFLDQNKIYNKTLNCTDGTYYPIEKLMHCRIIYNGIYNYHDVIINDQFLLKDKTFLSNSLCDSYFIISTDNSSIGIPDQIISISNFYSKDFYVKNLLEINYNVISKFNNTYSISKTDSGNDFVVNSDYYNMSLNVSHGANYELVINYLGRKMDDWENIDTAKCLTHEFKEDNVVYHYLYKINYPIILIEENDSSSYPIEITFATEQYANDYKDNFNKLDCNTTTNNIAHCKFKSLPTSPGIENLNLTNITNSDTSIYITLYKIEGNKCQPITTDFSTSDISIIISSHVDLGNITVLYANRNKYLPQTIVSQNSTENIFSYTIFVSDFVEGTANLYAIHEKIYTSRIPFNTGIAFYNSYIISSVEGILLKANNQQILIKYNNDTRIVDNAFQNFKLKYKDNEEDYIDDNITYNTDENSIVLTFNLENASFGNYGLYLVDICGNEIDLNYNIYVVNFYSKRFHYVIDNNYNQEIIGHIYCDNVINESNLSFLLVNENRTELINNKNGTFSYNISEFGIGDYIFFFKNFKSSLIEHNLNIIVHVVQEVETFLYSKGFSEDCYLYELNENLTLNWKDDYIINHSVYIEGETTKCEGEPYCQINNVTIGDDEIYEINKNELGLLPGTQYHILIIENDDKLVPIYSYNLILGLISLSHPNQEFIYLNAPYIKFQSTCKLFEFNFQPLNFSHLISGIVHNISCDNQDSAFDDSNKIYTCVIPKTNSTYIFPEEKAGYYNIKFYDYVISDRIFLSKAIEDAEYNISYGQLKVGNNTLSIKSEDFYIKNLVKFYIAPNINDIITYDNIVESRNIDDYNNSNSIIIVPFELSKGVTKYFFQMNRTFIDYDIETQYGIFNNYINFLKKYELKVSLPYVQFFFDKVYIIEESKQLCINNDAYNKISIKVSSNYTDDIESITKISVRYINTSEEETDAEKAEFITKINMYEYTYLIPNETELQLGLYKFYYHSTLMNEEPILIDTIVLAVKTTEDIFSYELISTCINKDVFTAEIKKNDDYLWHERIDLSNIGFLLIDENKGYVYKFNYNGTQYSLSSDSKKNITTTNEFTLAITEKDNRNCFVKRYDVRMTNINMSIVPNSDFYYEDYIILKGGLCILGNIIIINNNNNNNFTLTCRNGTDATLICGYDIPDPYFTYSFYDYYKIIYNYYDNNQNSNYLRNNQESEIYEIINNISIYNSILNATFNIERLSNDSGSQITINSRNFDVSKITEVNLINDKNETNITCKINSTICNLTHLVNNSINIYPKFQNDSSYYIYSVKRDPIGNEIFEQNLKIINLSIDTSFSFSVDKPIVVLDNYNVKPVSVIVSAPPILNIDYVYTLDSNNNQKILTQNSSNIYIFESSEAGLYNFYYTLPNQDVSYPTSVSVLVIESGKTLFNITPTSKCITKEINFSVTLKLNENINYPQYFVFLNLEGNSIQLESSSSNTFSLNQNLSEGEYEYELLIYDKDNNLLYNSKRYENLSFFVTSITHNEVYFKDSIYVSNLKCKLENLSLRNLNGSTINLTCEDSNNTIICKNLLPISVYGNYYMFYNTFNSSKKIYISNTIDNSSFTINPENSTSGQNIPVTITLDSENFYMKSIEKIIFIPSKNEDNITIDNLTPADDSLSFVFNGSRGNNYTIVLSVNSSFQTNFLIKILEKKLYISAPFSLNEFFRVQKKDVPTNFSFLINVNETEDADKINTSLCKPEKIEQNEQVSVNVSCVNLTVSEDRIIEIYYDNENNYIDYFYIFTGQSNGKYCGNNNAQKPTTNNFKLNIPREFKKTIEIKFEPSIGDDDNDYCVLYDKIYYCNGTSTENPANVRITIDSSSYIFPLENISNVILNSFSSVESSLVEGINNQKVYITFENDLSYKEIKECIISGSSGTAPGQYKEEETKNLNDPKKIIYEFDLSNYPSGNNNLICTNLCNETYNKSIEIISITCIPPYTKSKESISCKKCIEIDSSKPYFKDGECVDYTTCINAGYGVMYPNETSYYCYDSKYGLIKYNNIYYLPQSDYSKENSNNKEEDYCEDLCDIGRYKECDKKWFNCTCNSTFKGIYCQNKSIDVELKDLNSNFSLNLSYIYLDNVVKAISILYLLEKNQYPENTTLITEYMDKFSQIDFSSVEDYNIYYFVEIFNYFNNKNPRRMRRLTFNQTSLHNLNKQLYQKTDKSILSKSHYKIFSDSLGLSTWIWYFKNDTESVIDAIKSYEKSSLSVLDLSDCLKHNYIIILTISPPNLYSNQDSDLSGIELYYSIFNENNGDEDNNFKASSLICEKASIYISQRNLDFDIPFYSFYKKGGIDIYNKNDKAFLNPCFESSKFNWDLTQKFRKINVYQNITYNFEDRCKYIGIDYLNNKKEENINSLIQYQCRININKNEITIYNSSDIIENSDKEYNLPFKCHNKVKKLYKNIAFWLYFIIILLYIASWIVNTFYYEQLNGNIKGAKNDKIELISNENSLRESHNESFKPKESHNESFKPKSHNESFKPKESQNESFRPKKNNSLIENGQNSIIINQDKKSEEDKDIKDSSENNEKPIELKDSLINNFLSLHPLLTIGRCSIIRPLMITQFIFLFNISNIFGFNAVFLNEKRIKRKIWDKGRKNFAYPMRHEFGRIVAVILITMILTVLARLMCLVSYHTSNKTKITLKEKYQNGIKDFNEYINEIFNKNHQIFKTIASTLMFLLTFFFWYYTIIWCFVYYNSQFGLLYTLIWSLFWIWIVFAPINILVISIFESILNKKECAYYAKNLFCF